MSMKRRFLIFISVAGAALLVVSGLLIFARRPGLPPQVKVERYLHQHLPSSEWEPKSSLAAAYTVREADTLARIAAQRYGHQHYSDIIKEYNHIADAAVVAKGVTLRLPDISAILAEAGFTNVAAAEMQMILCARAKYDRVKNQLMTLRFSVALRERVTVPHDVKQELLEAADDLQQATEGLKKPRPGVRGSPAKMIGQLESVRQGIRELAEGSNDGYGYDIDMVQQRFALGLTNGLIWAREGFK